jgi:Na+/H+-dicarboxylate symporter
MKLHWKILIGMCAGVVIGLLGNESFALPGALHVAQRAVVFLTAPVIGPAGQIFIKLLKMLIVPLILASMITGVAKVGNVRHLGRIGGKTFIYYLTTTGAAVLLGIVLVNILKPGAGGPMLHGSVPDAALSGTSVKSIILNLIPDNIFRAMAAMDVLPIIVFALFFGSILTTIGERGKPLIAFFESLDAAMMKCADVVIWLAPFGVCALIAAVVAETGPGIFVNLGRYIVTVLIGLAIHAFITLPLLTKVIGRASPRRFVGTVAPALTTAFSTASSSATLPLTMECVERKAGIKARISSFVLPLGATVNMDGTALYESVASVFIAQVYGIDLGLHQQILVFLTATLAAVGAAGIPSAGLVTMAIVLKAVGLPLEGIGMILAVDRILDMCRTAVNVWGDAVGCVVVSRLEGEEVPGEIR